MKIGRDLVLIVLTIWIVNPQLILEENTKASINLLRVPPTGKPVNAIINFDFTVTRFLPR